MLFLVHFYGNRKSQAFFLLSMLAAAAVLAFKSSVDPFAWFSYLLYSLVIFWGAGQFKQWVFARSILLDEELKAYSKKYDLEKLALSEKENANVATDKRAVQIATLYEKAKEMSQCLDHSEALVVFGEALNRDFKFQSIKLVFFDEEKTSQAPSEVYELTQEVLGKVLDREALLKDKKSLKARLFPQDQKIFERLFQEEDFFYVSQEQGVSYAVYPFVIDKKIFAGLILYGLDRPEDPLLSILVESFKSDMQRVKLYDRVETLAITDGLTHMYVRRHLVERLDEEVNRCQKFGFKLSFLMIDVDHFKRFNDGYGHLVGDVVLKQVAGIIKKNTRELDLVGRYGGEEFGVLLVETDEQAAFLVAERIRRSIAEREFKAYDENLRVTVSIGCSTYSRTLAETNLIVEAADSALYQAKRQGRDRVCMSGV